MFNLAFYTYYFGNETNRNIPPLPSSKYDCFYFTNNKQLFSKLQQTKWITVFVDRETRDETNESNMFGKFIKSCPDEYEELKKYDFLCFFDDKINTTNEMKVEEFINKYCVQQNYAFLIKEHCFLKHSVYNEFKESMNQSRYRIEAENYLKYIQNQKNNGLSDVTERHCQTGFIIRNMRHSKIDLIDHTWYSHIQECGIQCQIAFFFVKQLFPPEDIYIFSTKECREVTSLTN